MAVKLELKDLPIKFVLIKTTFYVTKDNVGNTYVQCYISPIVNTRGSKATICHCLQIAKVERSSRFSKLSHFLKFPVFPYFYYPY